MSELPSRARLAVSAQATGAWLATGSTLDRASLMLTACALLTFTLIQGDGAQRVTLLLMVGAGLAEHGFALRTAFDARMFQAWALAWRASDAAPVADLAAFDQTLATMGLRAMANAPVRDLQSRIRGASRLWRIQAACLALQVLLWLFLLM